LEPEVVEEKKMPLRYSVTDLTRHVPEAVTSYCFSGLFVPELERAPRKRKVYPSETIELDNGLLEMVADITGTAIPAIYEYRSRGTCTLLTSVQKELETSSADDAKTPDGREHPFKDLPMDIRDKLQCLSLDTMQLSDFLLVANAANAYTSGYIHKLIQIKEYNWLEEHHVQLAMSVLKKHISGRATYEHYVGGSVTVPNRQDKVIIRGRVDVIDRETVWELKWTDSLRPEHVLQLVCYAALTSPKHPNRNYKLLHVPTGQIVSVRPIEDGFQSVLKELTKVRAEENRSLGLSDEAFQTELGRQFEGFINGLTIPIWLNTKMAQPRYK